MTDGSPANDENTNEFPSLLETVSQCYLKNSLPQYVVGAQFIEPDWRA